jgi:hypothetical protein
MPASPSRRDGPAGFRQAAADHVRVADRFDFFQTVPPSQFIKAGENAVEHLEHFSG